MVNRGDAVAASRRRVAWLALVVTLLLGFSIRLPALKITSLPRALIVSAMAAGVFCWRPRRGRALAAAWLQSPAGVLRGRHRLRDRDVVRARHPRQGRIGRARTNIYALFYRLRARVRRRSRAGALLDDCHAWAGGARRVRRCRDRRSVAEVRVAIVAGALILLEALAVPIPINQNATDYSTARTLRRCRRRSDGRAAAGGLSLLAQLPASAALLELPLGEPAFDIRYMFYSTSIGDGSSTDTAAARPKATALLTESLKDA